MISKKYIITVPVILSFVSSMTVLAHAGMMDRWLERDTSVQATCLTVIAVQLLFTLLFLVIFRKSIINKPFRFLADKLSGDKYVSCAAFWFLSAFTLTPYLFPIDDSLFGLLGLLLTIINLIVILRKKKRARLTSAKNLYVCLHVAACQLIGYLVFIFAYKTEWFKKLFSYTDDLYPGLTIYPKLDGFDYTVQYMCQLLAFFSLPYLIIGAGCLLKKCRKIGEEKVD